MLASNH